MSLRYDELVKEIEDASMTKVPALLSILLKRAEKECFKKGALISFIAKHVEL